jgi:hypothetical protein
MGKLLVTLFAFLPAGRQVLLHPRQIRNGSCTRTPAFAEATAVKAHICQQFKFCTVINFWLRDKLYRNTAPMPATSFVNGDKIAAPIKLVPPSLAALARGRRDTLTLVSLGQGLKRVMLW